MLPIYPIYPNEIWMEFNVSMAIPGPKIYSIPGSGDLVKKLGIENYNTSVLFPDIKYIKKFANYDMGIADSMLKSSMVTNLAKIKNTEALKHFTKVSGINIDNFDKYKLPNGRIKIPIDDIKFNNQFDMVGLKGFEKTIISSIFESQKPYFEIAQLSINYLIKIEDLIARFMPLVGAGINPLFALAIKSRKPKGNDGSYGSPAALGYSKDLKNNLNDFKKISTKGGKYDYTNPIKNTIGPKVSDSGGNDSQFTTVSIVYSTGEFQPDVKYIYEYIDLEDELEELIDIDLDDNVEDGLPKNIILGIFDNKGTPINPNDKLIVQKMVNHQLVNVDTGFKKADWLLRTDKWILNKSIKNTYIWDTLEDPLYYWSNGFKTIKSKNRPSKGFKQVKYKDIINFGDSKNDYQAFKKDEPVVEYNKTSYESYEKMLDKVVNNKLKRLKNISSEKKIEIVDNVSKLYKGDNNTAIPEIIDSLNIYSKLKKSYYDDKIDPKDNDGYVNGGFPDSLKRVFKPMNFNIGGEEKWIDPEIDYDIKVIRVDSVKRKTDSQTYSVNTTYQKSIKNVLDIKLFSENNPLKFNIDITKNNVSYESLKGLSNYQLSNWNFDDYTENILNSYHIQISLDMIDINPFSFQEQKSNIILNDIEYYQYINTSFTKIENKYFVSQFKILKNINNNIDIINEQISLLINKLKIGDITIEIDNTGLVSKFIIYDDILNINSVLPNSNNKLLPDNNKKNDLILILLNNNLNKSLSSIDLGDSKFSYFDTSVNEYKLINSKNLTNNHLVTNELYSKGKYGDSWKGGVVKNKKGRPIRQNGKIVRIEDNPNHVGWIKRDMLDEGDTETYYIIEGVLSRENKSDIAIKNGGSGFYRLFDAIGAIKVLIEMVIEMFTKVIPPMVSFIEILKNPPGFIVDIIIKKLGEHFSFFSPPALRMINKLPSLQKEVESGKKTVDQFRKIVNKSIISNYVFIENDGRYRFLLDGSGLTEFSLFGKTIQFGIKVKAEDVIPIELIFKVISDKNVKENNDQIKIDLSDKDKQFGENKNEIITNSNGLKYIETTTVQYSTGEYIEGVKYKYIYINEEIEKLIIEGDDIVKNNGDLDKAIAKYNLAVSKAKQSGLDTDDAFFKFITDKVNNILTLSTQLTQPLIKSILGFATLPLKIVGKIVEFLIDFVKSLIVLPEMPDKVSEFMSFKWIMKFFTPMGILELIGIKFDPTVLNNWFSKLESFGKITTSLNSLNDFKDLNLFFKDLNKMDINTINSKYKINKITSRISSLNKSISSLKSGIKDFGGSSESISKIDELTSKINSMSLYKSFDEFNQVKNFQFDDILFFKDDLLNTINNYTFDLSEFMSIDFELILPKVTIKQFTDMLMKPLRQLFPLLCLFEKIINSFIMLVWSIMGINAIIPAPLLRFCQPLNESLSPSDLKDILQVMLSNDKPSEVWVYDVKLENGEVKTFTNYNELQDYISENSNIEFNFNF